MKSQPNILVRGKSWCYGFVLLFVTAGLPAMTYAAKMSTSHAITLFMAGDIMIGRGIDQVLPHPGDPRLYEPYVKDAGGYVALAEAANGNIQKPLRCETLWGAALPEWQRIAPDVRLVNLETSITTSRDYWPGKGIHYKMHPENITCLSEAGIDHCSLANNHVLDWGYGGLGETLASLAAAGIGFSGAGENLEQAERAAIIDVADKGRIIVFSYGFRSSGISSDWAAQADQAGVNLLPDLSARTVRRVRQQVEELKQAGDIVIASIHWGSNWGYAVPRRHIDFAHGLIDEAGVDVIHGHSSHHPRPLEVYNGKLIIYGSGDFINDYEGIGGYEEYRDDLVLMYFADIDPGSGKLVRLQLVPMQIKRFSLRRASAADSQWLQQTLNREGRLMGTRLKLTEDLVLTLEK
ncbi:MAG: CapA family protein [Gammaproteobacteria bacterium]|nr:CapA family protein [Gammaproteobacteria bacterium]MDH3535014.1 CapA family protein [Gammaproteobacteria bacterium]